jgi:nucleotide-binding universal stress UspA family protein
MTELDRHHGQRHALHATASRYGEAVNRYLSATGYRPEAPARSAPRPPAHTTGLVVVGADDTLTSYVAVDHAAIEAEVRGWDLRIVHVMRPSGRRAGRDSGSRLLERLTDRVHAFSPTVAVTSRLIVGSAPATLLAAAGTADLVVVGHRHGAAASTFGISVGDRVAANHRGNVMVVRMPGWPPGPGFAHRPIVAGVAGATGPASTFAIEEARARGCDLVMLHAGPFAERTDRFEIVGGVPVHHRNAPGVAASALITASATAAALVIGRTGRFGVPGSLGSVGRTLVQRAHCPVFLVG